MFVSGAKNNKQNFTQLKTTRDNILIVCEAFRRFLGSVRQTRTVRLQWKYQEDRRE